MRVLLVCLLLLGLCSCKSEVPLKQRNFSTVKIETLLQDSLLNVRALEIVESKQREKFGFYATSKGELGEIHMMEGWFIMKPTRKHFMIPWTFVTIKKVLPLVTQQTVV